MTPLTVLEKRTYFDREWKGVIQSLQNDPISTLTYSSKTKLVIKAFDVLALAIEEAKSELDQARAEELSTQSLQLEELKSQLE